MHILIIPSWYSSRMNPLDGIFFREQAYALRKAGHKTGIIFPKRKSLKGFDIKKTGRHFYRNTEQGVDIIRSEGWNWFPRAFEVQTINWVRDAVRLYEKYVRDHGQPDIIHAHSILNAGLSAARINARYGVPFIVTEHASKYWCGTIQTWQMKYLQEVYKSTSRLVVVSPELGRLMAEKFECPSEILQTVPNKVDTDFFMITDKPESDTKVFLSFSFFREIKGYHILLQAFASRFRGKQGVALWIGGDGSIRSSLEKQAAELGIASQVSFLGLLSREQVRDSLQKSDVFVLPSLYETFGIAAIEAMACGKPVIATRSGGPSSIVTDLSGMLVQADDVEDLAVAMENILGDIHRFDPRLIRQDCIARFGEQLVIGQLEQIYGQALNDNNSTPQRRRKMGLF